MEFHINRKLSVPIRQQLKGIIEYGIGFGELVVGEPLPSVRELAEQVGVAPMTVSKVYQELKEAGLIETRAGSGTFVADSSQAHMAARGDIETLHRQVDTLLDSALSHGMRPSDIAALINTRLTHRAEMGRRVSVIMVGLFADAAKSYAELIAARLGDSATVEAMTIDRIQQDETLKSRVSSADLVVTFANQHPALSSMLPNTKVISIRFIPSEATRLALASLDSMARLLLISRFADFQPIIKSGVQRFAAHVEDVTTINIKDPHIKKLLTECDVAVFTTGAEEAIKMAGPNVQLIEYRHIPDPGDIERVIKPFIAQLAKPDKNKGDN